MILQKFVKALLHYALSHRGMIQYWRDVTNKSFYDNHITNGFSSTMNSKMTQGETIKNESGVHCICTGLRYFYYRYFDR